MYYSFECSYCSKLFFTFNKNRSGAARDLYEGIKSHLIEYGEDRKEYEFDEHPDIEQSQMYDLMRESEDKPNGGYEI